MDRADAVYVPGDEFHAGMLAPPALAVKLAMDVMQMFVRDVRVDLCGLNVGVAEECLH